MVIDDTAVGQAPELSERCRVGKFHVMDTTALRTHEVGVLLGVGAKTGGTSVKVDLLDKAALRERL